MTLSGASLQPKSLYITITIPSLGPYQSVPSNAYQPYQPDNFDPTGYEIGVSNGLHPPEEFNWGLYWQHDDDDGTWYTLCPAEDLPPGMKTPPGFTPKRSVAAVSVSPSALRLNCNTVGLVRVLALPSDSEVDIPLYLEWLTAEAAPTSERTFLWAVTTYIRCRKHVAHEYAEKIECESVPAFDINQFLREVLAFGYDEVWYCLVGGQLPRPVLTSGFGVELQTAGDM